MQTKILKVPELSAVDDSDEGERHRDILNNFLNFCKIHHIHEFKKLIETRQSEQHKNPQQDDSEPVSKIQINFNDFIQRDMAQNTIPASMTKGVTSKNRKDKFKQNNNFDASGRPSDEHLAEPYDPLRHNQSVSIPFIKFLMFFYNVPDFEMLIMKSIFPNKQRKLSHMIALNGHHYMMKDMLKQLSIYSHNCSGFQ